VDLELILLAMAIGVVLSMQAHGQTERRFSPSFRSPSRWSRLSRKKAS